LGHEKTVWNRSLYNTAKRIFLGTATGITKTESAKMVPVAANDCKTVLVRNGR